MKYMVGFLRRIVLESRQIILLLLSMIWCRELVHFLEAKSRPDSTPETATTEGVDVLTTSLPWSHLAALDCINHHLSRRIVIFINLALTAAVL
jgi:hypothetical protein